VLIVLLQLPLVLQVEGMMWLTSQVFKEYLLWELVILLMLLDFIQEVFTMLFLVLLLPEVPMAMDFLLVEVVSILIFLLEVVHLRKVIEFI